MDREDRTVYEGGQGEIIEKKSRVIATVKPVKTEEEAKKLLEEIKAGKSFVEGCRRTFEW